MLSKLVAVLGIALGVSTAGSDMVLVPIMCMGVGLLALVGVTEW